MTFIKDFECRGCGSTLGRMGLSDDGRITTNCFICGAGDWTPTKYEVEGLDPEEIRSILSREPGKNYQIIPRLAWGGAYSQIVTSAKALDSAGLQSRKLAV